MKSLLISLIILISFDCTATELRSVRFSGTEQKLRLVLDLSEHTSYKAFLLDNPYRLVVDLPATRLQTRVNVGNVNSLVEKVRTGYFTDNNLRLVVDLTHKVGLEHFKAKSTSECRNCVVLDLTKHNSPVQMVTAVAKKQPLIMPARPSVSQSKINVANSQSKRNSHDASPKHRMLAVSSQTDHDTRSGARDLLIAIDAGHGGHDPGAHGPNGLLEKDVTLSIAKKLFRYIASEKGMKATLIRDGDYKVELRDRIKRARRQKADLFISIHADAAPNSEARGSSVYVLSQNGASSEAARWLAEKENSVDLIGNVGLVHRDDMVKKVLLDMSQTGVIDSSNHLADKVLNRLYRLGDIHQKHIQYAGFAVLKSPDIPSILVETAFISNPSEERKLASRDYQDRLARAILDGVKSYFKNRPVPGTYLALAH